MSDITRVLEAIRQGDASAAEELRPLVYDELRKLAAYKMAHERGNRGDPVILPGRSDESPLVRFVSGQVEDMEMTSLKRLNR
ncbi:MAG: hypothetical protein FJ398_24910 [Verrucomicrobia bacterium]|nr:hypothetical protein [Verrucomicrobiota bacterium]